MIYLKQLREKRGLTQEQLETKSGVPQPTISGIESGKVQNPRIKTLIALANALKVKFTELAK
jgi:transcriptional regulator with XRE-family HTH domain